MKDNYEIAANQKDLEDAIIDLIGFNKFLSILYLKKINFPILNGIIVTKWTNLTRKKVNAFCKNNGFTSLLLRHDKNPEKPPYPRGGYLVSLESIEQETLKYLTNNRLVFWLEPANKLHNIYSINCLFDDKESIILEIVGPGFDASDLQRGDQSPHEIIELDLGTGRISKRQIYANDTNRYQKSVALRYLRVASNLEKYDEIILPKNITEKQKISETKKYLIENSFDLLSRNEDYYTPISKEKIEILYSYLKAMPSRLKQLSKLNAPFVVSCGYIHSIHRLVFWDITWPKTKYMSG